MTYKEVIKTREQAFCHLLLYFSLFEDAAFKGEETYQVYIILKAYPFTAEVNFPEEVNLFFDYKDLIDDDEEYLQFLVSYIASDSPFTLLFHAAQVAMSDEVYSNKDEASLWLLSQILQIPEPQAHTIIQLALGQRMLKINGHF